VKNVKNMKNEIRKDLKTVKKSGYFRVVQTVGINRLKNQPGLSPDSKKRILLSRFLLNPLINKQI
jgi:hypothetical protein